MERSRKAGAFTRSGLVGDGCQGLCQPLALPSMSGLTIRSHLTVGESSVSVLALPRRLY